MPKVSSVKQRMQNITKARVQKRKDDNELFALNSLNFTFSIIALGLHYMKTSMCFLLNNVIPPARTTFYELQKKCVDVIVQLGEESMKKWRDRMTENSEVSIDGSWNHRRNGNECQVIFCDTRTDKIIHVEQVTKTHMRVKGNYTGASCNMESEGVRRAMPLLKTLPIKSYVHDKDNKTRCIFESNWKELEEHIDPNHARKSIERQFSKFNTKRILNGLKTKLIAFFYQLLKSPLSASERKQQWLNAKEHYTGNHENCIHDNSKSYEWPKKNDTLAVEQLKLFLEKTAPIFEKVSSGSSTNSNESFNALRAYYGDKSTNWQVSYRGRLYASILQKNEPYTWIFNARERLGLPKLNHIVEERFRYLSQQALSKNLLQSSPEYRAKRNFRRKNSKKAQNSWVKELIDYKPFRPKNQTTVHSLRAPTPSRRN